MTGSNKAAGAHVPTGSAAAPAPEASSKLAAHPFFMKRSEKKELEKQQKETAAETTRAPTPNSLTDKEQPKSKRVRNPRNSMKQGPADDEPKRRSRVRKVKQQPVSEEPSPSSSMIQLPSTRTEIDPLTAAATAPPTPSSSPPVIDKLVVEAEAEVDPNHGRRKRRKQTPPQTSIRIRVDNRTGLILDSSPVPNPKRSGKLEVKYDCESPRGRLMIRAMDSITSEQLMPRSSAHPSSPVLPQLEDALDLPKLSTQEPKQYRTWSNYDKKTHILTITSSPPPKAAPKNAFTMLGKKTEKEKPAPVVKKDHEEKMSPKRTRKKGVGVPAEHSNAVVIELNSMPQWTCASDKPLHPFFNPAERKKMAQPPPVKVDSVPGSGDEINKADGSAETFRLLSRPPSRDKSAWAFTSSFGSSRAVKIPGTLEAPWPGRDSVHVRGLEDVTGAIDICELPGERKQKGTAVVVEPDQDVLISLASKLSITELRGEIASDDYATIKYHRVSTEVRLPTRKVVAGSQLQDMIRPRISARLPHPKALKKMEVESDSDNDTIVVAGTKVHPALLHLYQRLGTELTAFDKHEYDSIPWEVKYAPQTAGQVLQTHLEISVISKWLMGQKTDKLGVKENAGKRKAKGNAGGKSITKKKRKKKDDELDAFVITSEEEQSLMSEITDPEEDDWLNPVTKTKKSTIRACDRLDELDSQCKDSGKITNTIVVSGPTGCGKTAAVYAIAKELGYTVFEVNAGTRRNGKDVLDSVGDMSRNHHVHQGKGVDGEDNPFTRTKTAKERVSAIEGEVQMRQQQSLILFEEVDILFEEDKGFWSTILNLMGKSKRPIVLTCNDESQLPWDDLSLHAVLRFSQPAHDLLTDHLLLICANEGHLLQRPSVDALVTSTKGDIRASIMELQFYCRMAVGDRRGGLDWLLTRYPAGCDLTSDGERLRVVSEDTYHKGMGWIDTASAAKEENRWQQAWDEYGLDIGATGLGIGECTNDVEESGVGEGITLRVTDEFFGARSDTDAFAPLTSSRLNDPKLDSTHPSRTDKLKADDIYGYTLLQTDSHMVPGSIETELAIYSRSLSRRYLASQVPKVTLPQVSDSHIISTIQHRHQREGIGRLELQNLFSPLSKAEKFFASTPTTVHSSIFPSLRLLTTEIAPWARSILRYDMDIEKMRRETSSLLSAGGKRQTRAARNAVEGGNRARRQRWLRGMGAEVVARSAGEGWVSIRRDGAAEVGMKGG